MAPFLPHKFLDAPRAQEYSCAPDTRCCVRYERTQRQVRRTGYPAVLTKRKGSASHAMNTVVKLEPKDLDSIAFQEASLDIWDKKYRLAAKDGTPIDRTMDDTYQRVARALSEVEGQEVRLHWYEQFLWALRKGAIPAGRV